jgi:multiple sugar transport system substrate-binding protein
MSGGQEDALKQMTADFEKANPNVTVELVNQGKYGDLSSKLTATMQSPKDLPTITQAYPGWLFDAQQNDMLIDWAPYESNETIGWGDQEKPLESLLNGAKINDVQVGIPFNKSTEALFYNADLLNKYGVEVPTTLDELKEASKTIYEKSGGKVVGAGFDSLNNYYSIELKEKGVDFNDKLKFDGKESKEVIEYYAEGIKEGYFRIAGSDGYLSTPFANQTIAMTIGSTAGEDYVRSGAEGKFEYGVAARPTKVNLQQGTDIYGFQEASADQKTAAWEYIKFLTSPDEQLYWANSTGYMPVVESVLSSADYKESEKSKVAHILDDTTKDLFSIPVSANSDAAYQGITALSEAIYSKAKDGDINKLIEAQVATYNDTWAQ